MKRLKDAGWSYSISIRCQKSVVERIQAIPEGAWRTLAEYPKDGEAQIAETTYGETLMIVRRTGLIGPQAELWPDWRHFPFLTNRTQKIEIVEAEHRQHAVVELTIRDLKDQALAHFPPASSTPTAPDRIAAIAQPQARHSDRPPRPTVRAARTLRRRLLNIPGWLTRTARQSPSPLPAGPGTRLHPRARPNQRATRRHLSDNPRHENKHTRPPTPAHSPLPKKHARTAPPNHPKRNPTHNTA